MHYDRHILLTEYDILERNMCNIYNIQWTHEKHIECFIYWK